MLLDTIPDGIYVITYRFIVLPNGYPLIVCSERVAIHNAQQATFLPPRNKAHTLLPRPNPRLRLCLRTIITIGQCRIGTSAYLMITLRTSRSIINRQDKLRLLRGYISALHRRKKEDLRDTNSLFVGRARDTIENDDGAIIGKPGEFDGF